MKRTFAVLPIVLILPILFSSCISTEKPEPSTVISSNSVQASPKIENISPEVVKEPQPMDTADDAVEPKLEETLQEPLKERLPSVPPPASISRIFPDPYLAEAVAGILNKNINDAVTAEELAGYTGNLNCPPGELSDLSGIGYLTGLTSINCTKNEVKTIPAEIKELVNLETLDFGKAYSLEAIPAEIGALKNLKYARFYLTSITSIPKEIGKLKNLRGLQLGANSIQSVPKEIGNLKKLQWLDLHYNHIDSIPESICNLTDLRNLDLSHNEISKLPANMGNLTKLESLNLFNNKIKHLTKTMAKLINITDLNVYDNFTLSEDYKNFMPKLHRVNLTIPQNTDLAVELPAELMESESTVKYEFKPQDLFMETCYDYTTVTPQFSSNNKLVLKKGLFPNPGMYEFKLTKKKTNTSPTYELYVWSIYVEY